MANTYQHEILLIEDNLGDVRLTQEAFSECGANLHISVIQDGFKALQFLKQFPPYENERLPDLIIMDLNIPKWDGKEILKKIKEDSELKHIPVIVLTTSQAEADVSQAYGLHANCYVNKPVDLISFFSLIELIDKFWLQTAVLPKYAVY